MSDNLKKILLYLRVVMPILFLSIGIYCLVFPEKVRLEPQTSKIMGSLLIVYGIFRGYRAWRDVKQEKRS